MGDVGLIRKKGMFRFMRALGDVINEEGQEKEAGRKVPVAHAHSRSVEFPFRCLDILVYRY
jgi:hypothetical protein